MIQKKRVTLTIEGSFMWKKGGGFYLKGQTCDDENLVTCTTTCKF